VTEKSLAAAYPAKTGYMNADLVADYERRRFSGALGQYRWRREQAAVGALIDRIPLGSSVLDCPCGIGRWWPLLLARAGQLTAMDISKEMLDAASRREEVASHSIELLTGDAEAIPLEDGSVDYVFSHALTKHLPWPVQYTVFAEFARVARKGIVCSFSVITPLNHGIWRRRNLAESYPFIEEELRWMAKWAGMRLVEMRSCTTPIGIEQTVLFEKADT
jgi:ubiquinone/menaquinone biosynthesis C-methylase UbiE